MCMIVYIVHTDENPSGILQPFIIIIHIMLTACAAACCAICGYMPTFNHVCYKT